MYNALENMGFKRGNILEPSCGVGNFMGLLPESMDAKMYGVELDSLSGRIARQLYQKNGITIDGYEKTHFPDSFFDVAIGNVPFNDFKLLDMCAHNGTHIDAPRHFIRDGKTVDEKSLEAFIGMAYVAEHSGVVTYNDATEIIEKAKKHHAEAAKRILIKGDVEV